MFAFSESFVATVPFLFKVGMVVFCLFKSFTVFQNCLRFLGLRLLKNLALPHRISWLTLFLWILYWLNSVGLLHCLARLNSRLRFVIALRRFVDIQGRFLLLGRVFLGMHSSMISTYFCCHLARLSLTSSHSRESQSVPSIRSHALVKSAWSYFQIILLLVCAGLLAPLHFKERSRP